MTKFVGARDASCNSIKATWTVVGGMRKGMRGAVGVSRLLLIVFLLALLVGASWWFLQRSGDASAPLVKAPSAEPSTAPAALESISVEEDLSTADLFKQARVAMSANRMATPAGNNALEYYLRILARKPGDSSATEALRELFPFATGSIEEQISQGNFDEANRIMALLTTADPSNYTLTILRSKLEARRRFNDREVALQTQKEVAAANAAARPVAAQAAAAADAEAPVAPLPAAPVVAAEPAPIAAVVAPPAIAPAAAPVGETREVRVVTPPSPRYPAAAVRSRQNGWVEVEFTVEVDGSVKNARVTAAEPRGVFDREALEAVQKAKFDARLDQGRAVASTLRRRIEFKMN